MRYESIYIYEIYGYVYMRAADNNFADTAETARLIAGRVLYIVPI